MSETRRKYKTFEGAYFRLPPGTMARVRREAYIKRAVEKRYVSLSDIVSEALELYFAERGRAMRKGEEL